ncbi:hypothetical protein J5277_24175 [Rhizobium sp. 16-449-1b]|uniref:hypothetical protein n=1 Tax=Rhizobium sp. 16-449-1b TaxID=2819989 RepID=UPI001ADAA90A|nr:hypothetical protein [Rhizobium sp. 16-449-1b]MBO9197216.1 hypothetical protein [Rhizobium sp. 16-449-1b]
MRFKLTQIGVDKGKYRLEAYEGYEGIALELPSFQDATHFAENYSEADDPPPAILIRNDRVADAHGFWLQTLLRRGTGQLILAKEKMLVSCNSIRRG